MSLRTEPDRSSRVAQSRSIQFVLALLASSLAACKAPGYRIPTVELIGFGTPVGVRGAGGDFGGELTLDVPTSLEHLNVSASFLRRGYTQMSSRSIETDVVRTQVRLEQSFGSGAHPEDGGSLWIGWGIGVPLSIDGPDGTDYARGAYLDEELGIRVPLSGSRCCLIVGIDFSFLSSRETTGAHSVTGNPTEASYLLGLGFQF